jgi:hypothetical protein
MLGLPFGALAAAGMLGAGLAVTAGRRLPRDAQAALAPILGFAVLATTSTLVTLVPVRVVTVVSFAVAALYAAWAWRRVRHMLRAAAPAAVVSVVAIALAAAPSLAEGNWMAKSYAGNTDSYLWVSQARSFLDGPPPKPASDFPDRVAYERASEQHWAIALPVENAQLAWVSGRDPADVYGALAALLSALLPLSAFVVARACLCWSRRLSTWSALAVAANASLLFASYFSWQQQLQASAMAFAGLALLRRGLEVGMPKAEILLAALLSAASVAVYRMAFAPYLAASVVVVFLGFALPHWREEWRRAGTALLTFVGAFVLLASASIVGFVLGIGRFVDNNVNTGFKKGFPEGLPAEALGFVPRVWGASPIWVLVATAIAASLLFEAYRQLRRKRPPRADFLLSGLVLLGVGYVLALLLSNVPPYVSYKLLSYGTVLLVLSAVAPLALLRGRRTRLALGLTLATLTVASSTVAIARGIDGSRSSAEFSGLSAAASKLPTGAVVSVELDSPWEQSWAIYALRGHRLSIVRPEFILTEVGLARDGSYYRHQHTTFVLAAKRGAGRALWRSGPFALASDT